MEEEKPEYKKYLVEFMSFRDAQVYNLETNLRKRNVPQSRLLRSKDACVKKSKSNNQTQENVVLAVS